MKTVKKVPTEMLLAQSFKELVCKEPLEKITIKQITDGAGVIRPTFYNHFTDKYNLMEWILIQEILMPIRSLVENGMIDEALLLVFCNVKKEKDFYVNLARMQGQNSLEEMVNNGLKTLLTNILEEQMKGKQPKNSWLTPGHIAEFYAQSMTYIVMTWVRGGMQISPEELMEVYRFMVTRSLNDVIKDMELRNPHQILEEVTTFV